MQVLNEFSWFDDNIKWFQAVTLNSGNDISYIVQVAVHAITHSPVRFNELSDLAHFEPKIFYMNINGSVEHKLIFFGDMFQNLLAAKDLLGILK